MDALETTVASAEVHRLLARFPLADLRENDLDPGLLRLFPNVVLLETLERYLDRGCDAQVTARELQLHRATLYYRLKRIEQVASVDLKDGEQRLALHMSLKLARLARLHPLGELRDAE